MSHTAQELIEGAYSRSTANDPGKLATDGELLGVFVDDRRDPNQRATFLAEYGEIVETGRGTFLVLMNGNVQRVETSRHHAHVGLLREHRPRVGRVRRGAHADAGRTAGSHRRAP